MSTQTSKLTVIPGELRNQIYQNVLELNQDFVQVCRKSEEGILRPSATQSVLALLLTCRQILFEAFHFYYKFNAFKFTDAKQMTSFLKSLSPSRRNEIKSIYCDFYLLERYNKRFNATNGQAQWWLRRLLGLRELSFKDRNRRYVVNIGGFLASSFEGRIITICDSDEALDRVNPHLIYTQKIVRAMPTNLDQIVVLPDSDAHRHPLGHPVWWLDYLEAIEILKQVLIIKPRHRTREQITIRNPLARVRKAEQRKLWHERRVAVRAIENVMASEREMERCWNVEQQMFEESVLSEFDQQPGKGWNCRSKGRTGTSFTQKAKY